MQQPLDEREHERSATLRIGFGEDAHRLVPGRPLILGGIEIADSPHGADAHSDGDALLHALADALLAAFAQGDIGQLYPPSDPTLAGIGSHEILAGVQDRLQRGVGPVVIRNVAAVITLDRPRLGPHRQRIAENVARLLGLEPQQVGIGFKTSEGLAPHHVQARVTVLMALKPQPHP